MHQWLPLSPDASWLRDAIGYLAGGLVLCTFSVRSMGPLRCLGIASNFLFISYAVMAGMLPILILHSLLLPLNIYRLVQLERDRRHSPGRVPSDKWRALWDSVGQFVPCASGMPYIPDPHKLLGRNARMDERNCNATAQQNQ